MTEREFYQLVERMRDAQRTCLRTKDKRAIVDSRLLEAEVDEVIRKFNDLEELKYEIGIF